MSLTFIVGVTAFRGNKTHGLYLFVSSKIGITPLWKGLMCLNYPLGLPFLWKNTRLCDNAVLLRVLFSKAAACVGSGCLGWRRYPKDKLVF